MKRALKTIAKWIGIILLFPVLYLLIAVILSYISVEDKFPDEEKSKTIYLNSNGVHLDIVLDKENLPDELKTGLIYSTEDVFLSFGWGDEGFYINTPTWGDLTIKTAINAAFFDSPTLMHMTPHKEIQPKWIKVSVAEKQLQLLISYITDSFSLNENKQKILIPGHSYGPTDSFYKAMGKYTIFNTCNTWVNSAFKASGMKASIWTPFDFGVTSKYKD